MKISRFRKKQLMAAGMAILAVTGVYCYNHFSIDRAVKPTKIVMAAKDIPSHTKITDKMIVERTVPGDAIPPNAIKDKKSVIGKWTIDGFSVTKNSFLYKGKVVNQSDLPDAAILSLKENEVAFPLLVDIETSNGNSIVPGSYVDLYFVSSKSDSGGSTLAPQKTKVLFGGLFQHIRVTAAKDNDTNDAFAPETEDKKKDEQEQKKITRLYTFAVSPEQLQYLNRAKQLGQIIPVATGISTKESIDGMKTALHFQDVSDQDKILAYIEEHSVNPIKNEVKASLNQELALNK